MTYLSSFEIETSKESNIGISFFEYFFVFVLIIYAGRSNTFVEKISIVENPIGTFIPILLSSLLAIKWRIVFNKQFSILIICLLIYFIAISIKYHEIRPTIFLDYFFKFFIVYATVKALKYNLFPIYEYLLYCLAIIALFMWCFQIILGNDTLYNHFNKIPSIDSFSYVSGDGLNAILYSIQPTTRSLLYGYMIPRNCGYVWEPGGFAAYLCLAILNNLFISKSDKNSKTRFWVLLLALLSTQSTTGYVIFIVLVIYKIVNKKLNILLLLMPVLVSAIIYLFSLPFMRNKIIEEFSQIGELDMLVENSIAMESSYAPGRFLSFVIAFRDFRNNPIFGLGSHNEESWTNKAGASISVISGIGYLLAQFGIVGFLFFILVTIRTSIFFSKYFNYKGRFLLFFIIILASISNSIVLLPLVMGFWMFALFEHQKYYQEIEE